MLATNKENILEAYAPAWTEKSQDMTMCDFWRP